jgi:hypothetical protein
MAIAYRSDTGILAVTAVTGQQTKNFVSTNPSAGDAVFSGGAMWNAASWTETIDDNQWNTYTRAVGRSPQNQGTSPPWTASGGPAIVAASLNVASSGTFTARWQCSAADTEYMTVGAVAFSGVRSSGALDVTATNGVSTTAQSSQTTGTTAATAQEDEVAISALMLSANNNYAPFTTTNYTQITSGGGSGELPGGIAYRILSATGTQSLTWTYNITSSADTDHAAVIAVYKGLDPWTPEQDSTYKVRLVASPMIWR